MTDGGKPLKYRPDIDGIRALAILPVLAFHAFPHRVPGGFIGVDIFFVVSGYLISFIIFNGLQSGDFSFASFYAFRIRRIFPPLACVLIFSLAFGWFVLLPDEYEQLGRHIAASAAFLQNFNLLHEAGYFDIATELKPLMHLWSLAIEEQFYIVFPVLIWASWRLAYGSVAVILLVLIVSFSANLYESYHDLPQAFLAPQTRAWELMAGAALAYCNFTGRNYIFKSPAASLLSLSGAAIILLSMFMLDAGMVYPGWRAALPVLGTVLLIGVGDQTWFNRVVLSNNVIRGVGIISYALYLWHWPLLSFARIMESKTPALPVRIGCLIACFVLSYLSNRFIERPIRYGKERRNAKAVALLFVMAAIGAAGYMVAVEQGFGGRVFDPTSLKHLSAANAALERGTAICKRRYPQWTAHNDSSCIISDEAGRPTVTLIGDSHAGQLYPGLSEYFAGKATVEAFPASCAAPFLDVSAGTPLPVRFDSYKLINTAIEDAARDESVKVVVLAHQPECSYEAVRDIRDPATKDKEDIIRNGMKRTVAYLLERGKQVVLIIDNPPIGFDPKRCQIRPVRLLSQIDTNCSIPRSSLENNPWRRAYNKIIKEVAADFPQVVVFDLPNLLCDPSKCYVALHGTVMYRDENHLNNAGSAYVTSALGPLIARLLDH
jgi:peptidoglycan/LPS O-acetylase OafA/YrhL